MNDTAKKSVAVFRRVLNYTARTNLILGKEKSVSECQFSSLNN